ncbi:MAG TPA: MFS transporter [Dongiaceae bacterium]|nr:MFS transporter [Dongiaceae bacterium]
MFAYFSPRWLIVALGFLSLSVAFAVRGVLGLMMPIWNESFGWSRSFLSTAGAAALIIMALLAPAVGNLVDKSGARKPLIAGMLIIATGSGLLSLMHSASVFFLGFGIVSALGFGIVTMSVMATAIAPLFEKNRGLAIGITTAGATAGQLLIIPLFAYGTERIGWRSNYAVLALICLGIAVLLWVSLKPTGPRAAAVSKEPTESVTQRLLFLVRSPIFHALFWSFMLCGFTTAGVVETHFIPYVISCGYPPLASATAYSVLSGFNMVGMTSAGYLSDRMNRPQLLSAIYILRAASFFLLLHITNDLSALSIFAVAFGIFDYSTVPVMANILASHLGTRVMGLAMGVLAMGHALGAAAGAYLGGYIFDLYARYTHIWTASIALALVAGLIVLTIREIPGHQSAKRLSKSEA